MDAMEVENDPEEMENDPQEMETDTKIRQPDAFNWRNHQVNSRSIMPDVTRQIGETCFAHAIAKAVEARLRFLLAKRDIPYTFDRELNLTHSMAQADISIQHVVDNLYNELEIERYGMRFDKVKQWAEDAKFTTTFVYPHRQDWKLKNMVRISELDVMPPVKKVEDLQPILDELLTFGPFVAIFDTAYNDWDVSGRTVYKALDKTKTKENQGGVNELRVTGHTVVISGYDKYIEGGCFIYQNHSGPHFGEGGYGRMIFSVPHYFIVPRVIMGPSSERSTRS